MGENMKSIFNTNANVLTPEQFKERIFTFSLMLGIGIALLGAVLSAQAQAAHWEYTPSTPWCSQNYRASSYALGLGSAFSQTGNASSSHFFDSGCFALGKNTGLSIRAIRSEHASDLSACESAFNSGMRNGINVENTSYDSRYADCEQAGYSFGEALVAESARGGGSTQACNQAYKKGYADGQDDAVPQAFANSKEDFCYSIGFDDGAWFGR